MYWTNKIVRFQMSLYNEINLWRYKMGSFSVIIPDFKNCSYYCGYIFSNKLYCIFIILQISHVSFAHLVDQGKQSSESIEKILIYRFLEYIFLISRYNAEDLTIDGINSVFFESFASATLISFMQSNSPKWRLQP